jgi:DNA-binding transcriptional MerR regulator
MSVEGMNDRDTRHLPDRWTDRMPLLTIGQLSGLTGVPVRTIRFYSDTLVGGLPLVRPAGRTQAGYRLYDAEAAARLELIRTLRELDVDLPAIARVLARETTVAEVARAHADALEATVRAIRLRQAVLRAVASRDSSWQEMEIMHNLAKLDASERKRLIDGYFDRVFGGIEGDGGPGGRFAQMMRSVFPELPEDPNERQVEAWVELVALIQDEDFIAVSRRMAEHGARKTAQLGEEDWQRDQNAFGSVLAVEAETSYQEGVDPASPEARSRVDAMMAEWADLVGKPDTPELRAKILQSLDTMTDRRVNRFWHLVGLVGDRPRIVSPGAPRFEAMEWLISALRNALEPAA